MPAAFASLLVLFFLLTVGGGLVLLYLVRSEAEPRDRMSREEAREVVSREQDRE